MAFHEVQFPDNISRGARGGPQRRTQIVELASGREERNASWSASRRRYDVSYGVRRADDLHAVVGFLKRVLVAFMGFGSRIGPITNPAPPRSASPRWISPSGSVTAPPRPSR